MCHNGRNTDLGHNLDLLEKETATHSSNLAWKIPWTEKPGGLQSMGSHRVRLDLATKQQQLDLLQYCWFFTLYILFFLAIRHMGPELLDQGLNQYLWHWKAKS